MQPLLPPLPLLRLALAAEAVPRLVRPLAAVLAAEALRRLARPPLVAEVSLATLSIPELPCDKPFYWLHCDEPISMGLGQFVRYNLPELVRLHGAAACWQLAGTLARRGRRDEIWLLIFMHPWLREDFCNVLVHGRRHHSCRLDASHCGG